MPANSILVTAPRAYSKRFAQALEAHHVTPVTIPVIETVATPDTEGMRALLADGLDGVDYIAFCSRCAVDSLRAALEGHASIADIPKGTETEGLQAAAKVLFSRCELAAIGKDADYVEERLHVRPSICPDEPSPSGIAVKLAAMGCAAGRSIAVLAPRVEGFTEPDVVPRFVDQLESNGMRVVRVDAYVTRPVRGEELDAAAAALSGKLVRGVAFTSGGEVTVLFRHAPQCLQSATVACFGPYTAGCAEREGVAVSCVSKDFSSFDGFAACIEQYFSEC